MNLGCTDNVTLLLVDLSLFYRLYQASLSSTKTGLSLEELSDQTYSCKPFYAKTRSNSDGLAVSIDSEDEMMSDETGVDVRNFEEDLKN